MQKKISVDFIDTEIDDVIRIMAEQANVDVIKSPKVTGTVTAKLSNVPLEEALRNILASQGYDYVMSKNMIRIAPTGEITQEAEKLVTKIYRITYADIKELEKSLSKCISQRGFVSINQGTSNVIVNDTESKIKAIDTFIEEIDRVTPQVLVECRIYDVTTNEGFDLNVDWYAGNNPEVTNITRTMVNGTGSTNTSYDKTDNSTGGTNTSSSSTAHSNEAIGTVDTIDPLNTGTVTTDTTTTTNGTALTNNLDTTTTTDGTALTRNLGTNTDTETRTILSKRSDPFVNGGFDPINGGKIKFGFLNDNVDISFMLNMLRTNLNAKLLANPRILVLDNESANIKIVQEIPYQELTQASGGGNIGTTVFKNVGVELTVTPHITRDGLIRLNIKPKFSTQVSVAQIAVPGTASKSDVPVIDSREASTIAFARDGQTIVMGGLRKQEKRQDVSKVPIIGDIPLIGTLFTSNTESLKITELIVFVTPRIITQPVLSGDELHQYTQTEVGSPKMGKMVLDDSDKEEK
ncbi:MAG: secretin and TonB N-terminal domain-containing protein [Planctomycetes bacterium]|nr:secretin and TonB N-terminal domain-containing protein [Planctomycetota bacterium]